MIDGPKSDLKYAFQTSFELSCIKVTWMQIPIRVRLCFVNLTIVKHLPKMPQINSKMNFWLCLCFVTLKTAMSFTRNLKFPDERSGLCVKFVAAKVFTKKDPNWNCWIKFPCSVINSLNGKAFPVRNNPKKTEILGQISLYIWWQKTFCLLKMILDQNFRMEFPLSFRWNWNYYLYILMCGCVLSNR